MPTLSIKVDVNQVIELINQLDQNSKQLVFDQLKEEVLSKKWDNLLTRIDERLKQFPISDEEIELEVERARKEIAARCR